MRSLKKLKLSKGDLIIGEYYAITTDSFDDIVEWVFRFTGLGVHGNIMSDITYFKEYDIWRFFGGSNSQLCDDDEIVDGSLRKCSKRELSQILNHH